MSNVPPLTSKQAAKFMNLSIRTLQRYRTNQDGPVYSRIGQRILYFTEDLLKWANAHKIQ